MGKNNRKTENKDLESLCLSIVKWGTYLALFTPLIVLRSSFFPFVTPKTIYFRILVDIIFAAYLILAFHFPKYRPKFNLLAVSVFLLVGVVWLTSATGINYQRSFWSTYERMTGIFTFLHLLVFFVVLTCVFKKRDDWDKLMAGSIIVGVLLCLYVLLSGGGEISTRGGGTIGNTSFMAAYLLFDVFFAVILFFERKASSWRRFSVVSLVILIAVLLTSTARGAIISFIGGLFLFFLSYLIFSEKKYLRRTGFFILFSLLAFLVFLLVAQPTFFKTTIDVTLSEMQPRFVVWEKAWKGFLEKPLFGWGPENFNVVFTKFFNSCMFTPECGGEIWFDRAHNIVLDTLVTMGIVGFLSYALVFIVAVLGLFRKYLKEREDFFSFFAMMILLIIYFFQNLFVFDMISSYAMFFFALSFVYFLLKGEGEEYEAKESFLSKLSDNKIVSYVFYLFVLAAAGLVIYFGNLQPADSAVNLVNMIVEPDDLAKATDFYKVSVDTLMEKYEAREQLAQKLYTFNFNLETTDLGTLKEALRLAEEEMEKSMSQNSNDFRPHLFAARLYFTDYRVTLEEEKLNKSRDLLEKAKELSPTNQQSYWFLADVYLSRNDYEGALNSFQAAADLEPRYGRSYWYLVLVHSMAGQNEQAAVNIEKASQNGFKWEKDLKDIETVSNIYDALKDDVSLIEVYNKALVEFPEQANLWAGLAAAYANLRETVKAKEAALRAVELDPSLRETLNEFLKDLPE